MKLKQLLVIVLFLLFLALSNSYTQENVLKDTGVKNLQQNNSVNLPETKSDKTSVTEKKVEIKTDIPEPVIKKKTSSSGSKTENQKSTKKNNPEKKITSVSKDVKSENIGQEKAEGDLLLINEGNFKYKRIPDIKLVEKKSETIDSAVPGAVASGNTQNATDSSKAKGFFGLGKTASDIIVKGGILLLILLIFILYKSRMSAPSGKSSKRRNVLNSYRK
jgi:hypothetical protein